MTDFPSPATRERLALSLPAVEACRDRLAERLAATLEQAEHGEAAFAQGGPAAALLVDMLLGQARRLVDGAQPEGLAQARAELDRLEVRPRHYSRFGDALVPVLKDLLGPSCPAAVPAAWCDTFWALVRAMEGGREPARP